MVTLGFNDILIAFPLRRALFIASSSQSPWYMEHLCVYVSHKMFYCGLVLVKHNDNLGMSCSQGFQSSQGDIRSLGTELAWGLK